MIWRRAIVTGSASGIGRGFAETLADQGAAVGLIDVAADGLNATTDVVRARGCRAEMRIADVSDASETAAAVRALSDAIGGLDLLVNCAAILGPGEWATQSAERFERVIRIDLVGTANTVRAALPALEQSRGAAIVLASTAAIHGWPALGGYSAAKFGVAGWCDAVRPELRRRGIGLTTVFPLLIDTPLLKSGDIPPILRVGRRLPPDLVVRRSLAGAAQRRARVYVPGTVRVIAALHGLAPSLLDWYGRRFGFE
ncbi:MAG TPA: SDR family NAD(P)-dependent oxidoreductase [Candidatus Binatia bacterium]|nr:SDR family NAD(P)-dependent oxidoreductase [Candidatus Binatia bacterium]